MQTPKLQCLSMVFGVSPTRRAAIKIAIITMMARGLLVRHLHERREACCDGLHLYLKHAMQAAYALSPEL